MSPKPSPNFAYLAHHDARLVALATQAEEHFAGDPAVTLFKLRQFGEVLAQRAASKVGLFTGPEEAQQQLIDRLFDRSVIGATQRTLFHDLRRVGNAAVHEGKGDHREALHQLRMARELAVWFQRSFGNNRKFDPGPFIPPAEPNKPETALHDDLKRLRDDVDAHKKELEAAQRAIEQARKAAEDELREKLTAKELAAKAREDAAIWEALANEQIEAHRETAKAAAARSAALEAQNTKLLQELAAAQAAAQALPAKDLARTIEQAAEASEAIELDEAATRKIIDRQLRDAGWEVDSARLTYERGVRPTKGKNLAIAEWPTMTDGKEGWADYVLFAGLQVVGVVEASRRAREALDAVPPLLEKLRQSILAAAFRGDLMKDWRAKHKDVEPATELLKRIQESIDDYADAPQEPVHKPYIKYNRLEDVAQRVMAEKAKLRQIIDRHGGVSAVAQRCGIPQPSLSRMLNSPSVPRRSTLYKIANALGLSEGDIVMEWSR